jgi:hypothetical protein
MTEVNERTRQIFWVIIATGIMLPWIVGIAVKLYLSVLGRPTVPWSYFLNIGSLIFLIPVSIWWAFPYIGLAYLGRKLLSHSFLGLQSYAARVIFLLGGLLGGCVGTIIVFVGVFWEFDPLFVLVPFWIDYLPYMGAGLFVGFLIARTVQRSSLERSN